MLAPVVRASVAPARPMNPSLARELGFLISDTSCLNSPRRSQQIDSYGSIKSQNTPRTVQNRPAEFSCSEKHSDCSLTENIMRTSTKFMNIKKSQRHGLVTGREQRTGESSLSDREKPHDLLQSATHPDDA